MTVPQVAIVSRADACSRSHAVLLKQLRREWKRYYGRELPKRSSSDDQPNLLLIRVHPSEAAVSSCPLPDHHLPQIEPRFSHQDNLALRTRQDTRMPAIPPTYRVERKSPMAFYLFRIRPPLEVNPLTTL
jgi:hypothetical protein